MRLTVFRALIVALVVLEIGKVPGYDISAWVYVILFLIDCFYIWARHLVSIWGLVNDYTFLVYKEVLNYKKEQVTKKQMKALNKDILK